MITANRFFCLDRCTCRCRNQQSANECPTDSVHYCLQGPKSIWQKFSFGYIVSYTFFYAFTLGIWLLRLFRSSNLLTQRNSLKNCEFLHFAVKENRIDTFFLSGEIMKKRKIQLPRQFQSLAWFICNRTFMIRLYHLIAYEASCRTAKLEQARSVWSTFFKVIKTSVQVSMGI